MARVLVLYATAEGQTRKIAERIAARLSALGHQANALRFSRGISCEKADAGIVGASVHYGGHPAALLRWVRANRDFLEKRPSAFFSVSLSARQRPPTAQKYVDRFLAKARWRPQQARFFAGALPYSRYPLWKRFLVLGFVAVAGGDTDMSSDYEYTDWAAVDAFAEGFSTLLT